MEQERYNRPLFVLALLTACATFPLIWMGGLVTSKGAGLSVPDWPNSYHYNMFLFPPSMWLGKQAGGIFYEHSHRLLGSLVGFLSMALCGVALFADRRKAIRWLGVAVLGMVIIQGVLGGLRVVWVSLDLAIVHACVAQAFFCLAAFAVTRSTRWWITAPDHSRSAGSSGRVLSGLAILAVVIIYLQLVVGALMRHYQAGLAIPDMPLMYGKWWPPINAVDLSVINDQRVWQLNMPPVTLGQIWLHFGHRVGAALVSIIVCTLVGAILAAHRHEGVLVRRAIVLMLLLITQMTLGIYTVLLRKPADIASLHVAVGALTLVTTFALAMRSARLYGLPFTHGSEARLPRSETPAPVAVRPLGGRSTYDARST